MPWRWPIAPGDEWLATHAVAALAPLSVKAGEVQVGCEQAERAIAMARRLDTGLAMMALARAAEAAILADDRGRCRRYLTELAANLRRSRSRRWLADTLETGALLAEPAEPDLAVSLLGAAKAVRTASEEQLGGRRVITADVLRARDRLADVLSTDDFGLAWDRGANWSTTNALDELLAWLARSAEPAPGYGAMIGPWRASSRRRSSTMSGNAWTTGACSWSGDPRSSGSGCCSCRSNASRSWRSPTGRRPSPPGWPSSPVDDVSRAVVRQTLVWIWKDEQLHAEYLRGELLRAPGLGSSLVVYGRQLQGALSGWTTATTNHGDPRRTPFRAGAAGALVAVAGATGRIPPLLRRELRYQSFRRYCELNVALELSAELAYVRLVELARDDGRAQGVRPHP